MASKTRKSFIIAPVIANWHIFKNNFWYYFEPTPVKTELLIVAYSEPCQTSKMELFVKTFENVLKQINDVFKNFHWWRHNSFAFSVFQFLKVLEHSAGSILHGRRLLCRRDYFTWHETTALQILLFAILFLRDGRQISLIIFVFWVEYFSP